MKIFLTAAALFLLLPGRPMRAQAGARATDLGVGKFLIAHRDAPDPRFAHTVILLVKYGPEGAMGVVVNRRTQLPLSRVLERVKGAKGRQDRAFVGGPVEMENVLAMVRSHEKIADGIQALPDVYVIASKDAVEKALAGRPDAASFRAYMGYSGWGPKQLEHEMDLEAWFVLRGDAGIVFDPEPDTVWSRLIHRTDAQIAGKRPPGLTIDLKNPAMFAKIGL